MSPLALVTAPVLYTVFSIAACFAGLAGLVVTIVTFNGHYISNVSRSMDALVAAMLTWDGRSTVSSECGTQIKEQRACRFCRVLCAILSYKIFGRWAILEFEHCEKYAKS